MVRTACIFIFLFCCLVCNSQIYDIRSYDQDDGLPSAYINDIIQNKDGLLYIATGNGFVKFDGISFKTYDTTSGLKENSIQRLIAAKNNKVYVGYSQGGITLFENNRFVKLKHTDSIQVPVTCMIPVGDSLIFGGTDGKIGVLTNNKLSFIDLEGVSLINQFISISNSLFAATDNGLFDITDLSKPQSHHETRDQNITTLIKVKGDHLIAGNGDGELLFFIAPLNANKKLKFLRSMKICNDVAIKTCVIKNDSLITIGTWGKGIFTAKILVNPLSLIELVNISTENGLSNKYINCIYNDLNDNTWIGTQGGGLFKFNSDNFRLLNKRTGLISETVYSVFSDKGEILLGLENGFQLIKNNKVDTANFYKYKNMVHDNVISISKFKNEILLGTEKSGLLSYNFRSNSFNKFLQSQNINVPSNTINHINVYKDSVIYISTIDGLFIYDSHTKKTIKLTTLENLPHNNILYTFVDSKQWVWFVSSKSSPGVLFKDSITLFKDLPNFKSYYGTGICEGNNGEIFISTKGDGVYRIFNGKSVQYTTQNGLGSNFILGLRFLPGTDLLICTHQNGFTIFDPASNKTKILNKKTSSFTFENTLNSITSFNETIYFGTRQGLVIYALNEKERTNNLPINSFLNIVINDKIYGPDDTIIELPYNHYDITFNFIGVEHKNPEKVMYEFKLEGLQDSFKLTNEAHVKYHKIKDGDFWFYFTSYNSEGVKNPEYKRVHIIIGQPFYVKWWFILLCLAFCIWLVAFIINRRTKILKEDNLLLEQKVNEKTADITKINKILEEKNFDITSSIDYAKHIQTLLLPEKQKILENLNCFIFFMPRDIVSGDFYWFHNTKDHNYIGVIDCTGHGVPGALMSVLGISYLNQIMSEESEPLPSQILTSLDNKIVTSLKQKEEVNHSDDGMDMAICRINKTTREVVFSGAGRPLYWMNNTGLIESKPAAKGIGGFTKGIEKTFSDETFTYLPNDMLYLFSDGYVDQFGGEKNKRYSTKRMKDLVTNIYSETCNSQLAILKVDFENWRDTSEQTDDVLVIGIKL